MLSAICGIATNPALRRNHFSIHSFASRQFGQDLSVAGL
jgi:hypothetical protein